MEVKILSTEYPFVAIQLGAASLADEGTDQVLDFLAEKAGVNAIAFVAFSWVTGTAGRASECPFPDHGAQVPDNLVGGAFWQPNPRFYGMSPIKDFVANDPLYQGKDFLAEVLPAAKSRDMQLYSFLTETINRRTLRRVPEMANLLEVDAEGRSVVRLCLNNPEYRLFRHALLQDLVQSYPIDGIIWCSERRGPIANVIGGEWTTGAAACFCPHCRQLAKERGVDSERARQGFLALSELVKATRGGYCPKEGFLVAYLRLLLDYPELLQWESIWMERQHESYRALYGLVKALRPEVQVGWHLTHIYSFSPLYRAEHNLAKMRAYTDFMKPAFYQNAAGPRFVRYLNHLQTTLFGDTTGEKSYALLADVLDVDEGPLSEMRTTGWSGEYVRNQTARMIREIGDDIPIYPGIDIDVPTAPGEKKTTPADVRSGVLGALDGGAKGVILSRKYAEMRIANVVAVGDALRERGFNRK